MTPFEKCPICGGEVVEKQVETLLRGGVNTAVLNTVALVCLHCGERLYDEQTVKRFEVIRKKLEQQQTDDFTLIGKAYQIA